MGGDCVKRPSSGLVPSARLYSLVVQRGYAVGSNRSHQIALTVSASFQLEPDRHVPALKRPGCVRPSGENAERPTRDRGLGQEPGKSRQEMLPGSHELPGDDDDDEE